MSNLGKLSIHIPPRVSVSLVSYGDFHRLSFTGPTGCTKAITLPIDFKVDISGAVISISYPASAEMWGTVSQNIRQMIQGVTEGFTQTLTLSGIGYKASCTPKAINLSLGFSQDIVTPIPSGVQVSCPNPTTISLKSNSKLQLTAFAHLLASFRPAVKDKYKSKGVLVSPRV